MCCCRNIGIFIHQLQKIQVKSPENVLYALHIKRVLPYCINEKYYYIPICQGINSPKVITNLYTIVFTEISIFERMTFMYLSLLSCNCQRIPQLHAKVTQHLVWLSPAIFFNLPQGMMLVHFFI
jgi:hypothetical protein